MAAWCRRAVWCVLMVLAGSWGYCEDPPPMDAKALMEHVTALQGELRVEAERLIKEEGAEKAIARLRAGAPADKSVAFVRLNLAAIAAGLASIAVVCKTCRRELT